MGEMTAVGELEAYRAVPPAGRPGAGPGAGPWPGLVLVHEAFGLDEQMRSHANRLAAMGYLVLAPDLLSRGRRTVCLGRTMAALRRGRGQAFDDLEAARSALLADPLCTGSVGVIGFCLGGGFALVLAGRPGWAAAAANYGATPRDLAMLDDACPVVASYGGRDGYLRGAASTVAAALTERGVVHDVKEYPEAGHAFLNVETATPWFAGADDPAWSCTSATTRWRRRTPGAHRGIPGPAPHQVTAATSRHSSSSPVGSSTSPPRFHSAR